MNIQYYIKTVYGKNTMYIADSNIAKVVSELTGRKVLTIEAMEALRALEHTFEQVLPPQI